jgi:hypothetical protein
MHSDWVCARVLRRIIVLGMFVAVAFLLRAAGRAPSRSSFQSPERADSILILKKDHVMELLAGG